MKNFTLRVQRLHLQWALWSQRRIHDKAHSRLAFEMRELSRQKDVANNKIGEIQAELEKLS